MSFKDGKDYLYLIWQDRVSRRQYIVGQLSKNGQYEFRYSNEIDEAQKAGFELLVAFDDKNKTYYNDTLFMSFASRLPDRKRKDIQQILNKYGLHEYDAYELLKASGARLPIDSLKFVDPILDIDTAFERDFYVAGPRHYLSCCGVNCQAVTEIVQGDEVFLRKEPDNKQDKLAIQIVTSTNQRIGYVPRYYRDAFLRLLNEKRIQSSYVKRIEKCELCGECVLIHIKVGTGTTDR